RWRADEFLDYVRDARSARGAAAARPLPAALVDANRADDRRRGARAVAHRWSRTMSRAIVVRLVIGVAAFALFGESLHVLGVAQILAGVARVGWGFAVVLLVAGARDVLRAIAWTRSLDGGVSLPFWPALRARLAGEALNTLLPMGVIVGEPVKAAQVGDRVPFVAAVRG